MKVQCPNCGSRFRFDDNKIKPEGSRVRCLSCSNIFTIHPAEPTPEPEFMASQFASNDDFNDFSQADSSPEFSYKESSNRGSFDGGQMFSGNPSENFDLASPQESSGPISQEEMMSQFTPGSQLLDIENRTGLDMNAIDDHKLPVPDTGSSAFDLQMPMDAFENPGKASSPSQPAYSEFAEEIASGSDFTIRVASQPQPPPPEDAPEPAGSIFGGDFAFEERAELTASTKDLRTMDDEALSKVSAKKPEPEKPQTQDDEEKGYDPHATHVTIPHAYRMLVEVEPEEEQKGSMELTLDEYRKQQERKQGVRKRFKINPFVGTRISGSETEKKSKTIITALKGVFIGMAVLGLITGIAMIGHGDQLLLHSYDPLGIFGAIFGF